MDEYCHWNTWITGWWCGTFFMFPYIGHVIIPFPFDFHQLSSLTMFPYIGNSNPYWALLTNIFFQRGWNHQPDYVFFPISWWISSCQWLPAWGFSGDRYLSQSHAGGERVPPGEASKPVNVKYPPSILNDDIKIYQVYPNWCKWIQYQEYLKSCWLIIP